ncbi:MAG: cobalamin B12-binding domain-containing protein [Phascolarctobacterium sp.]|nr:cobalamin B12-binding domain-containing protein [Phascolarctobacterium sp.]
MCSYSIGTALCKRILQKNAIEVTLIEETIQTPLLAVLAEITRAKPEVVGFSVHIWNKTYVYSLIELVRKVLPVAKIVVGGPEVAFEPERILTKK